MDYRSQIYSNYRSSQGLQPTVDLAAADRWGRAYDTWLRGWLPQDKLSSIVDVGCGGGLLLRFFQRHGYTNLTGVDLSPEQLAAAKHICANVHLTNATEFLSTQPERFEMIVSLDVIEHLTKDELLDFLRAAHAALRPGGRIILQTPNCASPFGIVQRYSDFTHEIGLTPNSLTWLLSLSGFQDIEMREQGPIVHGIKSLVRFSVWRVMRLGFKFFDLVETGSSARVYTRVFVTSAIKS